MPRNYVPKTKTYSDLKLQEALERIHKGEISYREAQSEYKIDKSLLWRRVHNYNMSKQGRKTVLSKEEEDDLAEKIKTMAKWGWALTRQEIRSVVHTYVVQNNINNNFKNNCPGKDWMQLFFQRNGLVAKKLEQLEKSRRQATSDPFIIYHFYEILEKTLTSLNLHDKPQQIFNLDETSFSTDPTRIKGVTGKGQKAHRIIQGSGKENISVLGCVSADGRLLPPLIIFKGQNLWSSWKGTKDIPGTTYACSEKGWMLTSIFNDWFANFCKTVTERPLLVIFDGHVTHLDPATIELAVRENVTLVKLPPHTTDILQPMDRSCFSPIKYKWNERLIEWQRLNQRSLTKSEFCDLLCEVWRDGLSKEVIQNSFRVTGLYPLNKDVYPKDRLDPVKLDRFNKAQLSGNTIPNPLDIFENSSDDANERGSPSILESETSVVLEQNIELDSRSMAASSNTHQVQPESRPTTADPNQKRVLTSSEPFRSPEPSCSFETLLLGKIKHTKPVTGKRRKIDGKGKLLTSDEYLKSIENVTSKQKTKKKSEPKQKNQKRKTTQRKSDTDTDIEEEEVPYEDESDVENISLSALLDDQRDIELDENILSALIDDEKDIELDESHKNIELSEISEAENQQTENTYIPVEAASNTLEDIVDTCDYEVGDFILVAHTIKNSRKHYVAKIEGSDNDGTFTVIYLKRAKKIFFVYPNIHIVYSIRKDEIVMKLPTPKQKCKRGALMFEIDLEQYNVQ